MECTETRKVLSRYLDGELSPVQMASVREHLARCPQCLEEYTAQAALWALLQNAGPIQAPELWPALEARLARSGGPLSGTPRSWGGALKRLRTVGTMAAAATLMGLFVWMGTWAGTASRSPDVGEHERTVAELAGDVLLGMEVVTVFDHVEARP
jgi:predicted anti-sigma-YlaC factor YlaD